jgi:hypothetical protein
MMKVQGSPGKRIFKIRILKHHGRALPSQLQCNPLEITLCSCDLDFFACRNAAGEAYLAEVLVSYSSSRMNNRPTFLILI